MRPVAPMILDKIYAPLRKQKISIAEYVLYKAALFFNPGSTAQLLGNDVRLICLDADCLSASATSNVADERQSLLTLLMKELNYNRSPEAAFQTYSALLLMSSTLHQLADIRTNNMLMKDVFIGIGFDARLIKEFLLDQVCDQ